jgi:hypothetical protein
MVPVGSQGSDREEEFRVKGLGVDKGAALPKLIIGISKIYKWPHLRPIGGEMETSAEVLMWMAGLALIALAAFVVYGWRRRARVRRVEGWVRNYLVARFGGLPDRLSINWYGDPLAPVLVNFADPRTGTRQHFRFACTGAPATFRLLLEREVER